MSGGKRCSKWQKCNTTIMYSVCLNHMREEYSIVDVARPSKIGVDGAICVPHEKDHTNGNMDQLRFDILGPLPETEQGNRYLLVGEVHMEVRRTLYVCIPSQTQGVQWYGGSPSHRSCVASVFHAPRRCASATSW